MFWGQNRGKGDGILTPNELDFPFVSSYVCANFGENRSRNATVRVLADGQTDTLTDANRYYNLSHAICYSYGTDNVGEEDSNDHDYDNDNDNIDKDNDKITIARPVANMMTIVKPVTTTKQRQLR